MTYFNVSTLIVSAKFSLFSVSTSSCSWRCDCDTRDDLPEQREDAAEDSRDGVL